MRRVAGGRAPPTTSRPSGLRAPHAWLDTWQWIACSCRNGFTQAGIDFAPTNASDLFVKDTYIRDNGGVGIYVHPSAPAAASIDGVRLEGNNNGVRVDEGANVTVRNSIAAGNANNGFSVFVGAGSADLNIESSVSIGNGKAGVLASGVLATARMSNTMVTGNADGLKVTAGGHIVSFGNNRIAGNGVTAAPTTTLPQN